MRYKVTGVDERSGEPVELEVEAADSKAALAKATRLGLNGTEVQLLRDAVLHDIAEANEGTPYVGLRFCGRALVALAWIQAIVGVVLIFADGWPGLIALAGAVVPAALGFGCLAQRDIALQTRASHTPDEH